MATLPNFYELLDLDPAIREWSVIEARLNERREEYSQHLNQGHKRRRQEAEGKLAMLRRAEAVLRDPEARRREAEAAVAARDARRADRCRALDETIALIGGLCTRAQLDRLAAEFADAFGRDEILARLRAVGVETPGRQVRPASERVDAAMGREVRDGLALLDAASLYELLGMDPSAAPAALRQRADELFQQAAKEPNPDARLTVRRDLLVRAKQVFADVEEQRRYDNHLLFERLRILDSAIELAGGAGSLNARQVAQLVGRAATLGVESSSVRDYVLEVAEERGWRVELKHQEPGDSRAAPPGPLPSSVPEDEPPPAPRALVARPRGAGVDLEWEAPAAGPLRYRVLRRALAPPVDEGDGELIAETADCRAEDRRLPAGAAWYFGVFTLRGGMASSRPASSGPYRGPTAGAASLLAPLLQRPLLATGLAMAAGAGGLLLLAGLPPIGGWTTAGGGAAVASAPAAASPPPAASAPPPAATAVPTAPAGTPPTAGPASPLAPPPASPVPVGVTAPPVPNGAAGGAGNGSAARGFGGSPTFAKGPPRRLVFLVDGDPLLLSAAEERLRQGLIGEGFEVAGAADSIVLSELLRTGGTVPSTRHLAPLSAQGIDALVWLRSEPLAERRLTYYGRTATAFTARLSLSAYRVDDGRGLGGGWIRQREYTAVNAAQQGRGFAEEVLADLTAALGGRHSSASGAGP